MWCRLSSITLKGGLTGDGVRTRLGEFSGGRSYLKGGVTWRGNTWRAELPDGRSYLEWKHLEGGVTWRAELPGGRSYLEGGVTSSSLRLHVWYKMSHRFLHNTR